MAEARAELSVVYSAFPLFHTRGVCVSVLLCLCLRSCVAAGLPIKAPVSLGSFLLSQSPQL